MPQVVSKPLSWFKPDPDQPRKVFEIEELRGLAATLAVKQLVPCMAKPCGCILDGERRWRAAMLDNKPDKLDVIIVTETLTPAQQQDIQLITSLQRAQLTDGEQFVAFTRWFELNPGATAATLAQRVGRNASTLTRIMSLTGGIEEVKKAAAEGKLSSSEWYPICRLEPEQQLGLLNLRLSGQVSRDQLAEMGRKQRNGNPSAPAVKAKIKLLLPSGINVQINGKEMELSDVVDVLNSLLTQARVAVKDKIDVKAFMAVLKSKTKDNAPAAKGTEHAE